MSQSKLHIGNPESLIYENELLKLTVLGGIKLEGLDRMRATLKVELNQTSLPPIRHNLDLYNDTQVEKLIRKAAERLEVGTSVIAASLAELTEALESYRLSEIEKQQEDQVERITLTAASAKTAKDYAQAPGLMQRTGDDLQATGIIGEWVNALLLRIVMVSRQCKDPLSAITLAKSGMGKSYLQEKVAATFPQEEVIESTMITESSFYRFGRYELKGKIFLIEDLDGAEAVLYPIREMQSKKKISKMVTVKDSQGKMKTVNLIVEGPISVCGCTTRERIYEDNANRSLLLHLDGSKKQDGSIMDYHRKSKAGKIDQGKEEAIRLQLEHVIRILEPIKIVNPYAELIELPDQVKNPRRTLPILLSFIEAITHYHQYQRAEQADPQTGEIFIETTPEDIEWAFKLLKDVLFRKSDELSGACRKFYEWIRSPDRQVRNSEKQLPKEGFASSDIRKIAQIHPRTLNRYLNELVLFGRLEITGGKKHRGGYQYQFTSYTNDENLSENLDEWMESTLQTVKRHADQRQQKGKKSGKGSK